MSSIIPPSDPRTYSTGTTAPSPQIISEKPETLDRAEDFMARYERIVDKYAKTRELGLGMPEWLSPLLQGITLATIVGVAFWLGTLSGTVNRSAEKVDKLSDAMIGPTRDSVSNRLGIIEAKLEALDKRLDQSAAKTQAP